MTWSYRIFRHKSTWKNKEGKKRTKTYYGVHEAYYDKRGKVTGWTEEESITGNTVSELIKTVEMILRDITKSKKDVIDYGK